MAPPRAVRSLVLGAALPALLSGCFGYRLIKPEEIEVPSYEPRPVPVPEECDALIGRAATGGLSQFTEAQLRIVEFCQHQQLIRAQEEEAAARRLEAHAETANFALRVATVSVGALIAILTWVF